MQFLAFARGALAATTLTLAALAPVQAGVITFEDSSPSLASGSLITASGGYDFTSTGAGFSGVDSASAFVFANAPANSDGQFLFALNNDGITMGLGGDMFALLGLDFSFIAPLGGLGAGLQAGQLWIDGVDFGGLHHALSTDFSISDGNGNFNFSSFATNSLSSSYLVAVTFTACVYQTDGSCLFNTLDIPAQFGVDNLRAMRVPEPSTAVLALAALAAFGFCRRRQPA